MPQTAVWYDSLIYSTVNFTVSLTFPITSVPRADAKGPVRPALQLLGMAHPPELILLPAEHPAFATTNHVACPVSHLEAAENIHSIVTVVVSLVLEKRYRYVAVAFSPCFCNFKSRVVPGPSLLSLI